MDADQACLSVEPGQLCGGLSRHVARQLLELEFAGCDLQVELGWAGQGCENV